MQASVDLSDIEQVVESLYSVNDPQYIYTTQSKLQSIQRSDQGWEMANLLLKSKNPTCQFFGSLTFRVRINSMTDEEIETSDLNQLLIQILQWLVYHRENNSAKFVLQKIISTLSFFFAKFPKTWPRCVESVMASMQARQPIVSSTNINELLQSTAETWNNADLVQGLWFCETLMQDLSGNQGQLTNEQEVAINEILKQNTLCATKLIKQALDVGNKNELTNDSRQLVRMGIDTLGAWITYFGQSKLETDMLQPFSEYLLYYLKFPPDEEVYSAVSTIISETYQFRPSFWPNWFKNEFIKVLLEQGQSIPVDEQVDERIEAYANMILGFCELYTQQCLEREGEFGLLMDILMKLTELPGLPVVDDNSIALRMLEFWTNFVEEYFMVEIGSNNDNNKVTILFVINAFWFKVRLPDSDVTEDWNIDSWEEFISFRRDFCDFLELVYPMEGIGIGVNNDENLFHKLVKSTCDMLNQQEISWTNVECNIFCLNGMSDALSDNQRSEFGLIFESPLFMRLQECQRPKVHTTVVSMIGLYDSFFETERGKPFITNALEYLFKSLANNSISVTASKSIYKLCNLSRKSLSQLLPGFINVYENTIFPDDSAQERTVCAIACVIEALPDLNTKAEYIDRLVSSLVLTIEKEFATNSPEIIEKIISLVKCIVAIGKGLSIPEEIDNSIETAEHLKIREFWNRDERGIRAKLLQVVRVLTIDQAPYNQQVDICEVCCDIFKQGFREEIANPFTFPGEYVVEFLQSKYSHGPAATLGVLTSTACCFLTSNAMPHEPQEKARVARTIIDVFFNNNQQGQDNNNNADADVQSNKLKLLTQLMQHHSETLLTHPAATDFLQFSVIMLSANTKFVLQEACKFWTSVINSTNKNNGPVYQLFASQICKILIDKISGGSARSDLSGYISLIRKLVFKFPQLTKQYFTQFAVIEPVSQALARKDGKFRQSFIDRLFITRGNPQASDVVKDFWNGCRGLNYV